MIIDHPDLGDIPALRALWKEAFPDTDAFLELFFTQAFAPERALAVKEGNEVLVLLHFRNLAVDNGLGVVRRWVTRLLLTPRQEPVEAAL